MYLPIAEPLIIFLKLGEFTPYFMTMYQPYASSMAGMAL